MKNRIYITGLGIISAIGNNLSENYNSLVSNHSGISYSKYLDTKYKNEIPIGEVKLSNAELEDLISNHKRKYYSRTSLLALIAATEAINNSGLDINQYRTGLFSATSVGGMDKTEKYYSSNYKNNGSGRLRNIITHDSADTAETIAQHIGIKDFITTVSTACSSSANSIMLGARMIAAGLLDIAIAGGSDSLTNFTLNGFNSLMILDREHCKPFDKNRNGLNLGEGAAFIILQSEDSINKSHINSICELKSWANACDAYHQTASSPQGDGAVLAIQNAIIKAGLSYSDIDYINTHGTATPNNDLSESYAIKRVFNENIPLFSSTKPFTGHTLGASGAIESVFSCLAITYNQVFPNLNFSTAIEETGLIPVTTLINKNVRNVLSNSFGFGGNNSTLIFGK